MQLVGKYDIYIYVHCTDDAIIFIKFFILFNNLKISVHTKYTFSFKIFSLPPPWILPPAMAAPVAPPLPGPQLRPWDSDHHAVRPCCDPVVKIRIKRTAEYHRQNV